MSEFWNRTGIPGRVLFPHVGDRFRGEEGQGYEVICDDNHWDRAFRIPDRKLIGMCSESVFCLSENSKGLTLPKKI